MTAETASAWPRSSTCTPWDWDSSPLPSTPGVSGTQAIAALGSNLAAVAGYYGMTAEQLRNQLLGDSGLRLSGPNVASTSRGQWGK